MTASATATTPDAAAQLLVGYCPPGVPAAELLDDAEVARKAVRGARASGLHFGGMSEPVRRAIEALARHHGRTF